MVFTSFMDMIQESYGFDMVDALIDESNLPSKGAYTSVGTYPHTEMVTLLKLLSDKTKVPIPELLLTYGKYLFKNLITSYPQMSARYKSSKELFKALDGVIHVEVKKLYPDAELPKFKYEEKEDGTIQMHYSSVRHLEDLAEGLLKGALNHYGETAEMTRTSNEDSVVFTISYK